MKMTITRKATLLATTVAMTATGFAAHAQDWPQYLGQQRDGKVRGFTAPEVWPENLTKEWSVEVGDGVATPSLVGDRVFVFTRDDANEIIRCINAATGEEIWRDSYEMAGADGAAGGFSGPRSSPAVAGGKVLTIGVRGTVSCLDAETGEVLWRKDEFESYPRFFTSSSPMILGDLGITQLGGESEGAIVAYDLATGEQRWRWDGAGTSYASLASMKKDDQVFIVAETVRSVIALDATDGSLVWETPFAVRGRGYNTATPIVRDDTVLLSGSGRGTRATRIELAQGGLPENGGADAAIADEVWVNEDNSVRFSSPILKDDLVYGISDGGDIFCIKTSTGETAWTVPTVVQASASETEQPQQERPTRRRRGGHGGMTGYGSVVAAGNVLFALTPKAELIVFKPTAEQYTEIARYKVAEDGTYAYPVISGKRLFIKDRNSLTLWKLD